MKNSIFFTFLFSFIVTTWLGCKDNENVCTGFCLEGKILQYGTNKPVPDATIYLTECSSTGFLGAVFCDLVDSTKSDANGFYSFNRAESGSYILKVTAKNYASKGDIYVFGNTKNIEDIILEPYAWIKIYAENVPPYKDTDYNLISGNWREGGGGINEGVHRLYGVTSTTFKHRVIGNRKNYIYYFLEEDGKPKKEFSDSVYCKALDTTYYKILY